MKSKRLLGILHLVYSGLMVIPSIAVLVTFSFLGILDGDPETVSILTLIGGIVSGILIVLATPSLIVGIGLLNNKNWALILALVIGVLNILNFPFGTALGIFSIYVYNEDSKANAPQTVT
jgi:hypothetical protein